MTGIWTKVDDKWSRTQSSNFSNEEELHDRIVGSPEMLPLSGQPQIVAPYREVPLGGGSADVLAFETNGRPVIIEVKLSKNPEAKRPVVAQTLAYAAWLHGSTIEELEGTILGRHLASRRLADAIEEDHGAGTIDRDEFHENLTAHLDRGSFRLVIVLDDAPAQLVRLMGYLETITTDQITVDLVTVTAYEVNGAQVLVPQRIDPGREPEPEAIRGTDRRRSSRRSSSPSVTEGSGAFREAIGEATDEEQAVLIRKCADWADQLERDELCRVYTASGSVFTSLQPRLLNEKAALANPQTSSRLGCYVTLNRTVIARRAPGMLEAIDNTPPLKDGTGSTKAITDELLDALTEAYREAAGIEAV